MVANTDILSSNEIETNNVNNISIYFIFFRFLYTPMHICVKFRKVSMSVKETITLT